MFEYEGIFTDDMPQGQGRMTLIDHNTNRIQTRVFQGLFANGVLEGFGQVECENKFLYQGEWVSGKPLGFGTCTYNAIDAIYTGTWLNGKMNGQGQFVFQKSRYTI